MRDLASTTLEVLSIIVQLTWLVIKTSFPVEQAVKEMWAGLGYYSRAQRLWEGARKVKLDLVMIFISYEYLNTKPISTLVR